MVRLCTLLRVCSCHLVQDRHQRRGRCKHRGHNRTGEDACPDVRDRDFPQASLADARLKRHGPPSEAVVVTVTNGRLDGFALLAENFGTWERILGGQPDG